VTPAIAGRPETARKSVTKGMPETAGMQATTVIQATDMTPPTSNIKMKTIT
jgi:hypothetical protein